VFAQFGAEGVAQVCSTMAGPARLAALQDHRFGDGEMIAVWPIPVQQAHRLVHLGGFHFHRHAVAQQRARRVVGAARPSSIGFPAPLAVPSRLLGCTGDGGRLPRCGAACGVGFGLQALHMRPVAVTGHQPLEGDDPDQVPGGGLGAR